jgi:hypothetical protein
MFTLEELEEDPTALLELKEDVREECGKLGEVTNVVLFDAEKDGIMSVRFSDEECAIDCVKVNPNNILELTVDNERTIFQWSKDRSRDIRWKGSL